MRLLNKKDKNGFNCLTNEKLGNGFELFSSGHLVIRGNDAADDEPARLPFGAKQ